VLEKILEALKEAVCVVTYSMDITQITLPESHDSEKMHCLLFSHGFPQPCKMNVGVIAHNRPQHECCIGKKGD
jgi:hypothetical protein